MVPLSCVLGLSTPLRTPALGPMPAPPKCITPSLSPNIPRDLHSCPTPDCGNSHPTGPVRNRVLIRFRSSQHLQLQTSGSALQAQPPASRPTASLNTTSWGSPPRDPCSSTLGTVRPQPTLPSRSGPAAGHPAQSCSAPALSFPKHRSNWLKKQPLHNQTLRDLSVPLCGSLARASRRRPVLSPLSSWPHTGPVFQPHQLACVLAGPSAQEPSTP